MLAIGARSGDFSSQNADRYFYAELEQHLSWTLLRRGSLPLVQALALLANYLQKRDQPNSGFSILGAAINMAQGLGLHREFSVTSLGVQAMEIRRRVWWILVIFDAGARLTFGRPSVRFGGANVSEPCNIDDADLPADLIELPSAKDYATVTSSLIWQIKLARISILANERILQGAVYNTDAIIEINAMIQNWRSELPTYMRDSATGPVEDIFEVPRMVLLWRAMHLQVIIHRPFILSNVKQKLPLDLSNRQTLHAECISASSQCINSITSFWTFTHSHHGSLMWYACYWMVTAVFVHITCLLYEPQNNLAADWRHHINLARGVLETMSKYEVTAVRAVRLIDQLLGE